MPKTVRGNRMPNKNLINAFIIQILILRKNRLYLIYNQIACQKPGSCCEVWGMKYEEGNRRQASGDRKKSILIWSNSFFLTPYA
jgi:hypothetical protein